MLDEVVSGRYNAGKTLLATTNFPLAVSGRGVRAATTERDALEEAVSQTLEERVTSRVYSRLVEMCRFITVSGPDHRKLDCQQRQLARRVTRRK
jgi:hypothetical protein